jgi:hypothetical protein
VREHVKDDPAAVFRAIVPRRALGALPVPLLHPVAELAAHRQDAAEEPAVDQPLELEQPGKEDLVLDDTVPDPRVARQPGEVQCPVLRRCGRLFDVDVLSRRDGPLDRRNAQGRELGVEVDVGALECLVEVGRVVVKVMAFADRLELVGVPADKDRLRPDRGAVGQGVPALGADREERPDQVLVVAHPARDAVHRDRDRPA